MIEGGPKGPPYGRHGKDPTCGAGLLGPPEAMQM